MKREAMLRGKYSNSEDGFTHIELLIVIAIIGVLAAIAIPQFNQYKTRAYDSDAKSALHNIYIACKSYWADEGSSQTCSLSIASLTTYGFVQSADVSVEVSGTDWTFGAEARNTNSTNTFDINGTGEINRL